MQVWTCKIGGPATGLPAGADYPMRRAVERAYRDITGSDPEFIFSGWGGQLTEGELAVVEDRDPVTAHSQDCIDEMFRFHAATGGDAECICGAPAPPTPRNEAP